MGIIKLCSLEASHLDYVTGKNRPTNRCWRHYLPERQMVTSSRPLFFLYIPFTWYLMHIFSCFFPFLYFLLISLRHNLYRRARRSCRRDMSAPWPLLFFVAFGHFGECKLCDVIRLNGALGKPWVLYRLPKEEKYERVHLKYTEDNTRKRLLEYNLLTHTRHDNSDGRYHFNELDSSVVIQRLQKDDERDLELTAENGNGEHLCRIQLRAYEEISNLTVSVTEDAQNNTCRVTMRCLVQTGENVTFSWMKDGEDLSHHSSTLQISISSYNANSTYRCTARNPISQESSEHTLFSACSQPQDMCSKGDNNSPNNPPSRPPPRQPVSEQRQDNIHTVYSEVKKPKASTRGQPPGAERSGQQRIPASTFSSVYELAGPCRDHPYVQDLNEETRV
ncbi:uncharacterized protein [Engystomops pustulosus]|uniref:uncharacterized protein isoform X2 n=1 Tax=Engystomops pustulosus TaxID=76066 RepID=UPI003AFB7915